MFVSTECEDTFANLLRYVRGMALYSKGIDWKDMGYALALLFVLGLLLVILGKPISEGFASSDVIRCDVNSPCPGHLKCINGFCAKTDPVGLKDNDPLTLLSDGSPYPNPIF